ncbi:DUF481 domain-containing protein [Alteromonas oceanisediminis]|uniref:DUF481 domain-containing protein n=1 Tax=Alteromonas oceanisediminis TaxID=2836180 RepID=UPI001BD9DC55|nr:DUF481 domain-containing protein [Alteromonas oceanisediminis]MBT0585555.1 DUF481 domain-containing protein [Alteromonas oceanisediminis]
MSIIKSVYYPDFEPYQEIEDEIFTMEAQLGVLLATGNTEATSIKAGLDADHETFDWSNRFHLEMLYQQSDVMVEGREQSDVTAQRLYTNAQFDYKLDNPNHRLFLFGQYDNNRFSDYDYEAAIAAGWAQKALDEENYELRYSVGPGYGFAVTHDGQEDRDRHGFIVRASLEYKQQLSAGAKLRQYISTEAGESVTQSRSETSISAKIMGSLAMKLSFIMNYNSGAKGATEALDTETSIALVYQFF